MKKVFVLLLGLVLTMGVMAQKPSSDVKINRIDKNVVLDNTQLLPIDMSRSALLSPGDKHSTWINFTYWLCQYTVGNAIANYDHRISSSILFPDTFIWVRYKDMTQPGFVYDHTNWCSVGTSFDPTSGYVLSGIPDTVFPHNNASYKLDSISIPYAYERFSADSIVDTLVIQVYKPAHLYTYTYLPTSEFPNEKAFAVPGYNRSTKEGAMADYRLAIPLRSTDTTSTWKTFEKAIPNFGITGGGPVAVTWTFKSGSNYKQWDTMPLAKWDSFQGVQNPVNAFFFQYYFDQTSEKVLEYNNGVNVNAQQRYKNFFTAPFLQNTYLSWTLWGTDGGTISYPIVLYKISWTETVGINDLAKDVKVQLYPIPAERTQNASLDITLTNKKNISIDVYDLLGHKVSSVTNGNYNSGKHTFSIGTSDLSAGMYICNIVADGAVKTIKFEVR